MIRTAMKDAPLQTQQGAISKPLVQDYVDDLLRGSQVPAIKVDGKIIVDGNHRYVAGRIVGIEPAQIPWVGGRSDRVIPWYKVFIDPVRW